MTYRVNQYHNVIFLGLTPRPFSAFFRKLNKTTDNDNMRLCGTDPCPMVSPFLCIVAAQVGVNVSAVRQTILSLGILKVSQYLRRIAKAALADKRAPDFDVLGRQSASGLETPIQDVLVRATLSLHGNCSRVRTEVGKTEAGN